MVTNEANKSSNKVSIETTKESLELEANKASLTKFADFKPRDSSTVNLKQVISKFHKNELNIIDESISDRLDGDQTVNLTLNAPAKNPEPISEPRKEKILRFHLQSDAKESEKSFASSKSMTQNFGANESLKWANETNHSKMINVPNKPCGNETLLRLPTRNRLGLTDQTLNATKSANQEYEGDWDYVDMEAKEISKQSMFSQHSQLFDTLNQTSVKTQNKTEEVLEEQNVSIRNLTVNYKTHL